MADATGFISNGKDLNQIFAPIGVNGIDYGGLGNFAVGNSWVTFSGITKVNTGGNVTTTATPVLNKGFRINSAGLYRLNITLNFGSSPNTSTMSVVFILTNSGTAPASYDFIPSPKMSTIYAINCSGGFSESGNVTNNLNGANIANCLKLNPVQTATGGTDPFSTNPYFFSFNTFNAFQSNSNFFTLDITFTASLDQLIYPYIRTVQSGTSILLQNSTWRFIKLNNMPA